MSDKKGEKIKRDNIILDDEDYEYERKIAEAEKEKRAQLEKERAEAAEKRRRAQREAEKEREKQLAKERLELLQLKNGVIDEEEATIKEEHSEAVKLTGLAWWSNIWYHYKVVIIVALLFVLAVFFIIFEEVHKERADISIMMIANNGLEERSKELEEFFERYTDDIDGNGYVHVEVIMIPMNPYTDPTVYTGYQQKFIAQVQTGEGMIVITDSNTQEDFMELMKSDLAEDFPGNKYIDEQGFSFNSKVMAAELAYEDMPYDVHMSIRVPSETMEFSHDEALKNYENSYAVFKKIVEDITKRCEESNDPGLETEPIHYDDLEDAAASE